MERTVLVTGAAGFIGFHLSRRLWSEVRLWLVRQYEPLLRPCFEEVQGRTAGAHSSSFGSSFKLIEANLEDREAVEAASLIRAPQGG